MFGFEERREDMVNTQLLARGVRDNRERAAMRKIPPEDFLPAHLHSAACEDAALMIVDQVYAIEPDGQLAATAMASLTSAQCARTPGRTNRYRPWHGGSGFRLGRRHADLQHIPVLTQDLSVKFV